MSYDPVNYCEPILDTDIVFGDSCKTFGPSDKNFIIIIITYSIKSFLDYSYVINSLPYP